MNHYIIQFILNNETVNYKTAMKYSSQDRVINIVVSPTCKVICTFKIKLK